MIHSWSLEGLCTLPADCQEVCFSCLCLATSPDVFQPLAKGLSGGTASATRLLRSIHVGVTVPGVRGGLPAVCCGVLPSFKPCP
jgi:hypothetical protein